MCVYICVKYTYIIHHNTYIICIADGKGERVKEERLWTTRNTTTVLGTLSK